jgi:hypothetical protein
MDDKKKVLKERFNEVKNQILANSKDSHWAKNAIDELVSLKGQLDHEPTIVYLPTKDVEKQFKGETYEMSIMKDGTAVYHTYGGYTVVAKPNITSLAGTIEEYVNSQDYVLDLNDEDKENFHLSLSAFSYIMSLPTFAFSDLGFTYDMAGSIVAFLREKAEILLNEELKAETREDIEANEHFREAAVALQEIQEDMKQSV